MNIRFLHCVGIQLFHIHSFRILLFCKLISIAISSLDVEKIILTNYISMGLRLFNLKLWNVNILSLDYFY